MRVLVCGDRNWSDRSIIYRELKNRFIGIDDVTIVHGDCTGADRIAGDIAMALDLKVEVFPVSKTEWRRMGPAAGPLRNKRMLESGVDLVLAFHPDIEGSSKGTKDTVNQAKKMGIPYEVIPS